MIWRSLEASKATAKAKYLYQKGKGNPETNVLQPEVFQYLESMDPTPQKKYLQALCKWVVDYAWDKMNEFSKIQGVQGYPKHGGYLALGFAHGDDRHVTFIWEEITSPPALYNRQYLVSKIPNIPLTNGLQVLMNAEKKHIPLKDINSFKGWTDFLEYTEALDKKHRLSPETYSEGWRNDVDRALRTHIDDFEVVYRNKKAIVVKITDFYTGYDLIEALVGGEAHWCVLRNGDYWRDYYDDDYCFYVIINLLPNFETDRLYIAGVLEDKQSHPQVWTWEDDLLDKDESVKILKRFELSPTIFKYFESDPGDFSGYRDTDEEGEEGEDISVAYSFLAESDLDYVYPNGAAIQIEDIDESVRRGMVERLDADLQEKLEEKYRLVGNSYMYVSNYLSHPTPSDFKGDLVDRLMNEGYDIESVEYSPPLPLDEKKVETLENLDMGAILGSLNISKEIATEYRNFLILAFKTSRVRDSGLINFSMAWMRKMGLNISGHEDKVLEGVYHERLQEFFQDLSINIVVHPHKKPDEVFFTTDYDLRGSGFSMFNSGSKGLESDRMDSLLAEYLITFSNHKFTDLKLKKTALSQRNGSYLEDILAQILGYLIKKDS